MTGVARKKKNPQSLSSAWTLNLQAEGARSVDRACVGVADAMASEQILSLATDFGLTQICQTKGFEFDREYEAAQKLVVSPASFFQFPLASVMRPNLINSKSEAELTILNEEFDSSTQKRSVLAGLVKYMELKSLSKTVVEDAVSVADEFFTNAIFNAPFVDANTHHNPGMSRQDASVQYANGKTARIFIGADKAKIVIGCQDPFGSLGVSAFLKSVRRAYVKGPGASINFGPGGAGIGSYIIFHTACSLFVGVQPGRTTVFCCVIPLGLSYRKRLELPKHLHWIQITENKQER